MTAFKRFLQKFVLPTLGPIVTRTMLSNSRKQKIRDEFEQQRPKDQPRYIRYFHQLNDPYSVLTCQTLHTISQISNCKIVLYLCKTDKYETIPEPERLKVWGLEDTKQLVKYEFTNLNFEFDNQWEIPNEQDTNKCGTMLLDQMDSLQKLEDGGYILDEQSCRTVLDATLKLWRSVNISETTPNETQAYSKFTAQCNQTRTQLGHYSGAVFHYGKEFFWGVDRLGYLIDYLKDLSAVPSEQTKSKLPTKPIYKASINQLLEKDAIELAKKAKFEPDADKKDHCLQIFISYRSPYTYLGLHQLLAVSIHYDIPIYLRFIMPMVMRNTPVPKIKGRYIILDAKREAEQLGLSFGNICDPVGLAVERAMSLNSLAVQNNVALPFCMSFLRGVFADGISGATDKGMREIAQRAGLNWADCVKILQQNNEHSVWRDEAKMNQETMFDMNLWGPPTIKYMQHSAWGQDRIWRLATKLEQESIK